MRKHNKRMRRSAGTIMPLDLVRNRLRAPSLAATAADIEAVDRGEGRTVACMFRGTYGAYPRRFKQKMLDLTSDVLVLRPFWYNPNRKQMTIAERVLSAHVRPRKFKTDWNVRAAVEYAPGLRLEWAGFEVISCDTSSGTLEFAVPRPDISLVLHVLQRQHHQPQQDTPGEHT